MTPFLIPAISCFVLGFPACLLLRQTGVVDHPNARSSHSRPTVRGGGIAILAALMFSALFSPPDREMALLLAVASLIAFVSFVDDLRSVPIGIRFGCHAAGGLAALYLFAPLDGIPEFSAAIFVALAFFWVAGYTNAFNFMDGINGISCMQALVTGAGTGIIAMLQSQSSATPLTALAFSVAGAALGFLPHNFPKARMFMGDVSSAPLGFLLSALALWVFHDHGLDALVAVALLHLNYVMDTGITLFRRIARGEDWRQPHKEHFYQRLVRAGKSHAFVTLSEFALQLLVLALAVLFLHVTALPRALIISTVVAIWGAYFLYAEKLFQSSLQQSPGGHPASTASIA